MRVDAATPPLLPLRAEHAQVFMQSWPWEVWVTEHAAEAVPALLRSTSNLSGYAVAVATTLVSTLPGLLKSRPALPDTLRLFVCVHDYSRASVHLRMHAATGTVHTAQRGA